MMKMLHNEARELLVCGYEATHDAEGIAKVYFVSKWTVYRLAEQKRKTGIEQNGVQAGEYDDFFSTMLLGVQPYSTCLAYNGGAYQECLLSSFDSNKKILYANRHPANQSARA